MAAGFDADALSDLFSAFGPVSVRRIFGGAGVFADGVMFALVMGGVVYLRADAGSRRKFERERCTPFSYNTKRGPRVVMSYWRMPERLYDDAEDLALWAREALAAAQAPRARRLGKKRR